MRISPVLIVTILDCIIVFVTLASYSKPKPQQSCAKLTIICSFILAIILIFIPNALPGLINLFHS
ncbi:hypothetical protein CF067_17560 [Clostridium sporogenes]|uniref:Uncharacterized protein n=1 Tax=Clostridium botulinum B str. Osaka05 TaxID=1407017 RepID=A0A060NA16_CLOBO|nr:hypothetical protein [Clostridium botulinum]BAO05229.1 uncharacterized protein CBO05P2_204 [Clostridium botulinum B str. Osaka05]